jgi:hypothetical protein
MSDGPLYFIVQPVGPENFAAVCGFYIDISVGSFRKVLEQKTASGICIKERYVCDRLIA